LVQIYSPNSSALYPDFMDEISEALQRVRTNK